SENMTRDWLRSKRARAASAQLHGRFAAPARLLKAPAAEQNDGKDQEFRMDARTGRYHEVYARSLADPEGFWGEAAQAIDWYEPAKKVFDPAAGVYGRWFTGAVCNTCYNAIDRHVERGRAAQAAIIYDSPVTGTKRVISYAEL